MTEGNNKPQNHEIRATRKNPGIHAGSGDSSFIPSVFSNPQDLAITQSLGQTRRMESWIVSLFFHCAAILALFFITTGTTPPIIDQDDVVFVSNPIFLPFDLEGDGLEGGGGGGGGKQQQDPPATGELPETTPVQMIAPDPTNPQPLVPAEDLLAQAPSVEMPIELPRDLSLPIGDISAPPNYSTSSGSGRGGGIGTGTGTGIGSGTGAGVGPGSGGGMGGGSGGGIGSGVGRGVSGSVREPVVLSQPLPEYTEEGRKAKVMGVVVLEAIIRKDGTVDSFKVVRGLGYGLDESAVKTVSTKWRFRPATRNGSPVDFRAIIEVTFSIL